MKCYIFSLTYANYRRSIYQLMPSLRLPLMKPFYRNCFEMFPETADPEVMSEMTWYLSLAAWRLCSSWYGYQIFIPVLPDVSVIKNWNIQRANVYRANVWNKNSLILLLLMLVKMALVIFIHLDQCRIEFSTWWCVLFTKNDLTVVILSIACFAFCAFFIWRGLLWRTLHPVTVEIKARIDILRNPQRTLQSKSDT